jgi:insertion element IS1 protein InsB
MVPTLPQCPPCGRRRLIRFGFVTGKQRWRCKRCRYQFTRPEVHGTPEPMKHAAVSLYSYGLSLNAVADLLGTTAPSVMRWVCNYVDRGCAKPPPGEAVVIELDEMWHFLPRKDNKVWIGKAYDRTTGRLVDWECGDRDERTFRRRFDRLARWNVRLFGSDSSVVYPLVLAVGNPYQGKDETVALERNNAQQRHWTAALRRRSLVVSKSLAMPRAHPKDALSARQPLPGSRSQAIGERGRLAAATGIERRVALFAHFHVNKEVSRRETSPEMYRLPIQAGRISVLA